MAKAQKTTPKTSPTQCRLKQCAFNPINPEYGSRECIDCIHLKKDWRVP